MTEKRRHPATDEDTLDTRRRAADLKELRNRATNGKPTQVATVLEDGPEFPTTGEDGPGAVEHPRENPDYRRSAQAPGISQLATANDLAKFVEGERRNLSLLDDQIYRMRIQGMGATDIAGRLGRSVTVKYVEDRLTDLLVRRNSLTNGEYRALQVGRLEAILNTLQSYADMGSTEHIKLMLTAIERLNKIFELEKETSRVEIEVISDKQAETMQMVLEMIFSSLYEALKPYIPHEILRDVFSGVVADATRQAAAIIDAPATRIRQLD